MRVETVLKNIRLRSGLTQEELAQSLGVSRQSIIALECGRYQPSINLALHIAQLFDMPVEMIFRSSVKIKPNEKIKLISREGGGDMDKDREVAPLSPWRDIINMRDTIDRFFDDSIMNYSRSSTIPYPALNVRQSANEVIVEADVPGMKEDEIEIEITDNTLCIKGERKTANEVKKEDYYHREVIYGSFNRSITLPVEVNPDATTAKIEHGTLTVKLPKKEPEAAKSVKIKPSKNE